MNKHDWENAFGEPTKEFHEKLVKTLDGLERENVKMKKVSVKKIILVAAAISVLAVGSAAIATKGTTRVISGSSWSFPTYKEVPTAQELEKDIGISPKVIAEFSNGYRFDGAVKVSNQIEDIEEDGVRVVVVDEDGKEEKYQSLSTTYVNGENKLTIGADPAKHDIYRNNDDGELENYNGVSIKYTSFTNKFVPGDYVQTEQDIKDEEEGKYVFSYGTEEIEIHEVQGVTWTQDGIKYHINAMDSPLDKQALLDMAKEMIDF